MKLKRVTPEEIMELEPCFPPYDLEYVTKLFGKLKTVNALNVAKVKKISTVDRMWLMLQIVPDEAIEKLKQSCKGKDAYAYAYASAHARVYARVYAYLLIFPTVLHAVLYEVSNDAQGQGAVVR